MAMERKKEERARTVLVVDDNPLMRKLFLRCLEEGGYSVVEAPESRQAIPLMHETNPDLVLMDIMMPGMTGVQLIKAIREDPSLAGTMVVAVTNLASPADRRRLEEAGFDGHIAKPIRPQDFLHTVNEFVQVALGA